MHPCRYRRFVILLAVVLSAAVPAQAADPQPYKVTFADSGSSDIDTTLRAILRSGAFELANRLDVPSRVVISEYVDVAKAFFEDDAPGVVNAVLDALAHELRAGEFAPPASGP